MTLTIITMSGKRYPIEFENATTLTDLEKQINKLTGIKFVEQALENVYDEDEVASIRKRYEENGPVFINPSLNKFVSSADDYKDGEELRVVLSKH